MKKKIFLVLGLIVFAILAAGSVGGNTEAGKGNVNVAGSDAAPAAEKKAYDVSEITVKNDGYSTYVSGVLTNNGGGKGYVQIMIPCYDKDGAKMGDALANVNDIEANGKWKFKAMFLGTEKPDKCDISKAEVSGF